MALSQKVKENSEALVKQAKALSKKYIPPDDDLDRNNLGATLENDLWLQRQLEVLGSKVNINENTPRPPVYLPRFGAISYLIGTTTFLIFDVPELKAMIKTMATDGANVWANQDFIESLRELEKSPVSTGNDGIFCFGHELAHKFGKHLDRMFMYPPAVANKAQDCNINATWIADFPNYAPSMPLRRSILGATHEDTIYASMSSEAIADMMIRDQIKSENDNSGKGGKGNKKGSGSGGSASGSGGTPDKNSFSFGNGFDNGETHTIDPEKIMEVLKETGLGPLGEILGYPMEDPQSMEGKEAFEQFKEQNQKLVEEAVYRSSEDRERHGNKIPGAHMEESLSKKIKLNKSSRMDFRSIAPEVLVGEGAKSKHYADEVGTLYHVEEMGDFLGTPGEGMWLGAHRPYKRQGRSVVIIDTSASVSDEELQDAVTFTVDLVTINSSNDDTHKTLMASADTVARGEIIEVNDENAEELRRDGVNIFGRGGTDFDGPARAVLDQEIVKNHYIQSLIYITDLGAPPPDLLKMEEDGLLDPHVKVFFIATRSASVAEQEAFQDKLRDLGGRAKVIPLRAGQVLDLEDDSIANNNKVKNTASFSKRKNSI
jgi:hypothetical protein